METEKITTNEITHYSVYLDKSRSNGALHFTHELSMHFKKIEDSAYHFNGKIEFSYALVLNSSGWDVYSHNEQDLLEQDYPGAIEEAKKILIAEQNLKEGDFV